MTEYTPETRGLYNKYNVTRPDGTPLEGFHFTLRIYDPHARKALYRYAQSVKDENPVLSAEIMQTLADFESREVPLTDYDLHEIYFPEDAKWENRLSDELDRCFDESLKPITVVNSDMDVVAVVITEYDRGAPGNCYDPGEEGYLFRRFATIEEASAILKGKGKENDD